MDEHVGLGGFEEELSPDPKLAYPPIPRGVWRNMYPG
jgi:hypothetical protein